MCILGASGSSKWFVPQHSLDTPCDPNSVSEVLTTHPPVITAINCVVAAAGQISATVQTPFLKPCDASMGVSRLVAYQQRTPSNKLLCPQHHLPSCMRILEASHIVEILREAGASGLHIKSISEQSGIEASKLGQSLAAALHMASTYTFSLAHILRLLATLHILREITPDVFATNRISSSIDSGKSTRELSEFQSKWMVCRSRLTEPAF